MSKAYQCDYCHRVFPGTASVDEIKVKLTHGGFLTVVFPENQDLCGTCRRALFESCIAEIRDQISGASTRST